MDRKNKHSNSPLGCQECTDGLQEYLDGTLEKTRSLQFFLHLRDCLECKSAHDDMQSLYGLLENLPDHEVPADFDEKILASVPIESYLAMEPLRRQRVPVYLEEAFLPSWIRSGVTRSGGVLVAVAGVVIGPVLGLVDSNSLISLLGLVPEVLVRLQGVGRWAALSLSAE